MLFPGGGDGGGADEIDPDKIISFLHEIITGKIKNFIRECFREVLRMDAMDLLRPWIQGMLLHEITTVNTLV